MIRKRQLSPERLARADAFCADVKAWWARLDPREVEAFGISRAAENLAGRERQAAASAILAEAFGDPIGFALRGGDAKVSRYVWENRNNHHVGPPEHRDAARDVLAGQPYTLTSVALPAFLPFDVVPDRTGLEPLTEGRFSSRR